MIQNPKQFNSMLSSPTNGQSWSHEPKSMPWEKPPQYTNLSDAMHMLMDQLLEPEHLKELLNLMDAGMPIENIARVIIFTGFTTGKWTPDLGILMYKPLMLSLIAIAHRAGLKDTPIAMKESMDNSMMKRFNTLANTHLKKGNPVGQTPDIKSKDNLDVPLRKITGGFFTKMGQ